MKSPNFLKKKFEKIEMKAMRGVGRSDVSVCGEVRCGENRKKFAPMAHIHQILFNFEDKLRRTN